MYFEVKNDTANEPRWWLKGDNHQTVAVSGEAFSSTANATGIRPANRVVTSTASALSAGGCPSQQSGELISRSGRPAA